MAFLNPACRVYLLTTFWLIRSKQKCVRFWGKPHETIVLFLLFSSYPLRVLQLSFLFRPLLLFPSTSHLLLWLQWLYTVASLSTCNLNTAPEPRGVYFSTYYMPPPPTGTQTQNLQNGTHLPPQTRFSSLHWIYLWHHHHQSQKHSFSTSNKLTNTAKLISPVTLQSVFSSPYSPPLL